MVQMPLIIIYLIYLSYISYIIYIIYHIYLMYQISMVQVLVQMNTESAQTTCMHACIATNFKTPTDSKTMYL